MLVGLPWLQAKAKAAITAKSAVFFKVIFILFINLKLSESQCFPNAKVEQRLYLFLEIFTECLVM